MIMHFRQRKPGLQKDDLRSIDEFAATRAALDPNCPPAHEAPSAFDTLGKIAGIAVCGFIRAYDKLQATPNTIEVNILDAKIAVRDANRICEQLTALDAVEQGEITKRQAQVLRGMGVSYGVKLPWN